MIKRHCAWCDAASAFDLQKVTSISLSQTTSQSRYSGAFACQMCKRFSVGEWKSDQIHHGLDDWMNIINIGDLSVKWIPRRRSLPKSRAGVPEHIQSANRESHTCLANGSLKSAVLMARTTLEAICKDKGILAGSLVQKIDAMHAAGYVRETVKTATHAVRQLGNDMAHGDIKEEVEEQDARACLDVLDAMLTDVYEVDELTAHIQKAVADRKS